MIKEHLEIKNLCERRNNVNIFFEYFIITSFLRSESYSKSANIKWEERGNSN